MAYLLDFFISLTCTLGVVWGVVYLQLTAEGSTSDSELSLLGSEIQLLFHVIYDYVVGNL